MFCSDSTIPWTSQTGNLIVCILGYTTPEWRSDMASLPKTDGNVQFSSHQRGFPLVYNPLRGLGGLRSSRVLHTHLYQDVEMEVRRKNGRLELTKPKSRSAHTVPYRLHCLDSNMAIGVGTSVAKRATGATPTRATPFTRAATSPTGTTATTPRPHPPLRGPGAIQPPTPRDCRWQQKTRI